MIGEVVIATAIYLFYWKVNYMITEVELPKLNSRKKVFTRIIDISNGEVLVSAELTPAAAKRMIKHYEVFGIYGKVA